jgi:hypothetical protein
VFKVKKIMPRTPQFPFSLALLGQSLSYEQYSQQVEQQVAQGIAANAEMLEYTKLNVQRIQRWNKTFQLSPEMQQALQQVKQPLHWVVLTEGWCGDAAQNLPAIVKMAEFSPQIQLHLFLRDNHLPMIDAYLTNGGRSIPKLICLNEDLQELGTWGPRPAPVQTQVMEFMKQPNVDKMAFVEQIHKWYATDKQQTLQQEFITLLKQWS